MAPPFTDFARPSSIGNCDQAHVGTVRPDNATPVAISQLVVKNRDFIIPLLGHRGSRSSLSLKRTVSSQGTARRRHPRSADFAHGESVPGPLAYRDARAFHSLGGLAPNPRTH